MNLTKYFNFKFLKENFKQAKGILIFFISVLPIITTIYLVFILLGGNYVIYFSELGLISYILAFIVPFVISFILFGFVFKKKSVDFYLSQPVNRKTIFITNFLGGIFILLGIMAITSIIMVIFSLTTNLVMPLSMILDYFIFFVVTYLFMFSVATLAICLSGNLATSLVVTLLILCVVPLLKFANRLFVQDNTKIYAYCSSEVCEALSKENDSPLGYNQIYSITPIEKYMLTTAVSFPFVGKYQTSNVIYTLVIMLIYSSLGYVAFTKRKMENNECSFKSNTIYYAVKCLTLLPFVLLLYRIIASDGFGSWLMLAFLSLIYFFAYDLITKKRIDNFILNFNLFVLSMVAFHGVYFAWSMITNKDIYLKDIDAITVDYQDYKDLEITDKNYIERLIASTMGENYRNSLRLTVNVKSANKEFLSHFNIKDSEGNNILEEYIEENNIASDTSKLDYEKIDIAVADQLKVHDAKLNKLLNDAKNNEAKDRGFTALTLYYYENHELKEIEFPVAKSKELASYVSKLMNQNFIENLNTQSLDFYTYTNYGYVQSLSALEYILDKDKDCRTEIIEFLKEHQNDEVTDKYYYVYVHAKYDDMRYIINDTEAFDLLYQKILDKYKDDINVQNRLKAAEDEYLKVDYDYQY